MNYIADSSAIISKYIVLRQDSATGTFNPIDTIPFTFIWNITVTDKNVYPAQQSYSYEVEVFDSCGNLSVTSNVGATIFLTAVANSNQSNTLQWTPYTQWDGGCQNIIF